MAYNKLMEIRLMQYMDNTALIERLQSLGAPEELLPPSIQDAVLYLQTVLQELGLKTISTNRSLFHRYGEQCFYYLHYTNTPPKMLTNKLDELIKRGIIQQYTTDRKAMNYL